MPKIKGICDDRFPVDMCYSTDSPWSYYTHELLRYVEALNSGRKLNRWTLEDAINEGFKGFVISIDEDGDPCTEICRNKLHVSKLKYILDRLDVLSLLAYKGGKHIAVYVWRCEPATARGEVIAKCIEGWLKGNSFPNLEVIVQRYYKDE